MTIWPDSIEDAIFGLLFKERTVQGITFYEAQYPNLDPTLKPEHAKVLIARMGKEIREYLWYDSRAAEE